MALYGRTIEAFLAGPGEFAIGCESYGELNFGEEFADRFLGSEQICRVRPNDSRGKTEFNCNEHFGHAEKLACARLSGRYPFHGVGYRDVSH